MSFFVIPALQCDRIKGPKLQWLQRLLKLVTKMFKSLKTGKVEGEGLLCKGSCEGPGISWSNCQHLPHCHPHPSTVSLDWWILCFDEEIVKEAEVFLLSLFCWSRNFLPHSQQNLPCHHGPPSTMTFGWRRLCFVEKICEGSRKVFQGFFVLRCLLMNSWAEKFIEEFLGWEVCQGTFGLTSLWRIFWAEKFVKELLAEKFVKEKLGWGLWRRRAEVCEGEAGLRVVKGKLGLWRRRSCY